jgi:hypothetical protein
MDLDQAARHRSMTSDSQSKPMAQPINSYWRAGSGTGMAKIHSAMRRDVTLQTNMAFVPGGGGVFF